VGLENEVSTQADRRLAHDKCFVIKPCVKTVIRATNPEARIRRTKRVITHILETGLLKDFEEDGGEERFKAAE